MLIIPVGPPGCGKSTLAAGLVALGRIEQDAVVSPDDFRRILTGDRANQDENGLVFALVNAIIESRLRYELDVYVDATNLTTLDQLFEVANRTGTESIFVVEFDVDYDALVLRNVMREHPVPDETLTRMANQATALRLDSALTTTVQWEPYRIRPEEALTGAI